MDKPLRHLIEEISNNTMYQRSMQEMGIDQSQMPISSLKRSTIDKAKKILGEISAAIKELEQLRVAQYAAGHYLLGENYDAVQKWSA